MNVVNSILFIFKIFLAGMILVTFRFISRKFQRGFFCGDPTLSLNRKPDTISDFALAFWGFSPPIIILIGETVLNFEKINNIKISFKKSLKTVKFLSHRYLIDMLLMHIIINAVKIFAGSHRPHFFETCMPDKMIDCKIGSFVSNFTCTNLKVSKFERYDASLSFFSGHAATCVFSCFFIVWYLEKRLKNDSLFLVPFLQTSLICLSFYGSVSRVIDHRHHVVDVFTGAVFGLITTYHTCYILCKNQCSKPDPPRLPTESNNKFLPPVVKAVEE